MNKEEAYQKCIEILSGEEYDPEQIAILLAKNHPQIFVDLVRGFTNEYEREIINVYEDSPANRQKITAIKFDRERTGRSLSDSKSFVEGILEKYNID